MPVSGLAKLYFILQLVYFKASIYFTFSIQQDFLFANISKDKLIRVRNEMRIAAWL
jgi:hypothetical protein